MAYTFEDMKRFESAAKQASDEFNLGLTIDRCRHPSVMHPVIWLFHDGQHVGTVSVERKSIDGEDYYTATKMHKGMPCAHKAHMPSFKTAVHFAGTDFHSRPHSK